MPRYLVFVYVHSMDTKVPITHVDARHPEDLLDADEPPFFTCEIVGENAHA